MSGLTSSLGPQFGEHGERQFARAAPQHCVPVCQNGAISIDRGYGVDWFRDALRDKGMRACIPGRKQRKTPLQYDKRSYKRRNGIGIMLGRLKDWRRVAARHDRCPKVFLSAAALAATVINGWKS